MDDARLDLQFYVLRNVFSAFFLRKQGQVWYLVGTWGLSTIDSIHICRKLNLGPFHVLNCNFLAVSFLTVLDVVEHLLQTVGVHSGDVSTSD